MMVVVICYDINTSTTEGRTRLRRVSKVCGDHGQRVQDSVYEAYVDWKTYNELRSKLSFMIDPKEDSLLFYKLGRNWRGRVERIGGTSPYDPEGLLVV